MRAAEVGGYLRGYAALSAAPVTEGAEVLSVRRRLPGRDDRRNLDGRVGGPGHRLV
jgi:hypothetical protein